MFKSKLQEYCQGKRWELPLYHTIKEGPPHKPLFQTTVTVNGLSFTNQFCKTTKEGQNNAARLALLHFATSSSPASTSVSVGSSTQSTVQPNMMQETNQFRILNATTTVAKDANRSTDQVVPFSIGSSSQSTMQPNMMQETNQIPQVNATAAVAKDANGSTDQEVLFMSQPYKSQLQSYVQKRNLVLPIYSCERVGPPHAMRFKCKVTVAGQTYECPTFFPTLKEAEHGAAKVALMSLPSDGVQEDGSILYKNLLQELAQKKGYALPIYMTNVSGEAHVPTFVSTVEVKGELFTGQRSKTKKQAEMSAAKVAYVTIIEGKPNQGPTFLPPNGGAQAGHIDPIPSEPMEVVFFENEPMEVVEVDKANEAIICQHLRELLPQPGTNPTCKRVSSSSTVLSAPADVSGETFTNARTKIRVLPYTPNMTLPTDGTVVHRDERFVAVKLGSQSNQ